MEHPPTLQAPPRPIGLPAEGPAQRAGPGPRAAGHWPELDLLRALACTCMILNHAAVKSPGIATSPVISASEFVGGFAPVLFYFATGLGYGIQSARPGGRRGFGFLTKVAILLVADLDFFTFIGLSMLALELIRRLPRGAWVASGLGATMVLARFAAGPLLRPMLEGHEWGLWIGDVIGTGGHFGYPLGPWLAFPMFGYVLGKLAATDREAFLGWRRLPQSLVAVGVPIALACLVMAARGNRPFRYGTMNFSYFLASLAVIALSLSAVISMARTPFFPRAERWISLSGLRSFAVVPLHYLLLGLASKAVAPVDLPAFAATFAAVLILSFVGSSLFVRFAASVDRPSTRLPATAIVLALTVVYYAFLRGTTGELASTVIRSLFQLSLCLVLSFRPRAAGRG